MLPGWTTLGSTVPENRRTSTFWFTPICFSPATSKWPLGRTSTTVAVMDPEKVLALSVPPFPEKSLAEDVPTLNFANSEAGNSGKAETLASIEELRLTVDADFWLAVMFSTI